MASGMPIEEAARQAAAVEDSSFGFQKDAPAERLATNAHMAGLWELLEAQQTLIRAQHSFIRVPNLGELCMAQEAFMNVQTSILHQLGAFE